MKKRVLDYFISHQSKMAHVFIVNFSTTFSFFVYAGKSLALLEFKIHVYILFLLYMVLLLKSRVYIHLSRGIKAELLRVNLC